MSAISIRRLILFVVLLAMMSGTARSQNAVQWSVYRTMDGLPEPAWHFISFTPQGKLLAVHRGSALGAELDGYCVTNFPTPIDAVGPICESPGGQRWAMVPEGLAELKNDAWLVHPIPQIQSALNQRRSVSGMGLPFLPVRQGTVLFLTPSGLWEFVAESAEGTKLSCIRTATDMGIGSFTGMALARDEGLWVSGSRGIALAPGPVRNLEQTTPWKSFEVPEFLGATNLVSPEPDTDRGLILIATSVTNSTTMVLSFKAGKWTGLPGGSKQFIRAWQGPEGNTWAATANGLFYWDTTKSNWKPNEEPVLGEINDVVTERSGAFWLATSEGLYRGAAALWGIPADLAEFEAPVRGMAAGQDGTLYFISGNALVEIRNGQCRQKSLPPNLENVAPQSLYALKDGSLLIGGSGQMFRFMPAGGGSFEAVSFKDKTDETRALGPLTDGAVCVYARPTLYEFNGKTMQALQNPPPISGSDRELNTVFISRGGDLWIGGANVVLWRHDDKWQRFNSDGRTTPSMVRGFAETEDGKILCASPEELWEFDKQKWSVTAARFDHINFLTECRDGAIWLYSNGGLFRLFNGVWMENGPKEGLPNGAIAGISGDSEGKIWAATTRGPALFRSEADTNPPQTNIRWLAGNGHKLVEGDTLNLLFDGQDKWKVTSRDRLLYSYQLDQSGWSAFQDSTMFSMASPPAGRHWLQVRAMDRSGNVDPRPARIDFAVVTPWFRETRLWITLFLGGTMAIFFAGLALNRHRQLVRSHAAIEQKVAERTRELEIATQELLHSQKMNALGTLAAGIAHDFNNILSIIKGSAQIIEDNTDKPEKIRTRIERIKTVVQQGAEIVDAMLGFGRTTDASARPVNINAAVSDTLKLLGDRFLREVEVKFEHADDLPEITTSRDFIQQILLNFIFNAAEAMTERKQITLITRTTDELPSDIFLQPSASDSFVLVSVRDEGCGIPPDIKARIFEPFFTTKALSSRRGTGLGLSMVYELAKKMGAGLSVQSSIGHGSTFTLILPAPAKTVPQNGRKTSAETVQI